MAKTIKIISKVNGSKDTIGHVDNNDAKVKPPVGTKLQISANDKKLLSKNQQTFNKLTQQIEKLENEIINETKRFDKLTDIYTNEIAGLEIEAAQARLEFAVMLDRVAGQFKFSQRHIKYIREIIVSMCNMGFRKVLPTPEQVAVFDKWSDTSYKDELERQESEEKSMLSEMFEDLFGTKAFDEDGNLLDIEDLQKEIFEKFGAGKQQFQNKSKKQKEQEEAQRIEQELKNKSVRSIYIALAKVLHPDSETDPVLKHDKEQVMKQVTVAYEQNDLQTLLKLEMEWVHKTAEHLDELSEDKLKSYIAVLKEQVAQLKTEKFAVRNNPRYQVVGAILHLTEKQALRVIEQHKKACNIMIASLKSNAATITNSSSKSVIGQIAEYLVMTMAYEQDYGLDCDEDEDLFY